MAISLTALTSGVGDSSSGVTSFTTASVTPTANRLVLIDVWNYACLLYTSPSPRDA